MHALCALGEADRAGRPGTLGYLTYQDYRDRATTFDAMAAVRLWTPTLVAGGEAERLSAMRVSWTFFDVLGVRPALGTGFKADEDRPDQWRVVVLGDRLWRRRFSADPSIVGQTVTMNDETYRIAGVMPASFEPLVSTVMYQPADLWAPLGYDATLPYACRTCQHLRAIGRIKAGVTPEQAHADLRAIRSQLASAYPTEYDNSDVAVTPLQEMLSGPVRRLLPRPPRRRRLRAAHRVRERREPAARASDDARERDGGTERARRGPAAARVTTTDRKPDAQPRRRTARGRLRGRCAVGRAAACAGHDPRLAHATIDGAVLTFAFVLALGPGALFGILPALKSARHGLQATLALDSRTSVGGAGRAPRLLVVADLALALILLSGAALMLKSVERLMLVDPGFRADGVLTMNFSLFGHAYREDAAVLDVIDRVVRQVQALPGVEAAAIAGQIPLGGNGDRRGFHVEGRVPLNPEEDPAVERYSVTPGYFRVMGIPLERGRLISDADSAGSLPVVVVAESTARQYTRAGSDRSARSDRIGHRRTVADGRRRGGRCPSRRPGGRADAARCTCRRPS